MRHWSTQEIDGMRFNISIQANSSHIGPSEGVQNILLFYTPSIKVTELLLIKIESLKNWMISLKLEELV